MTAVEKLPDWRRPGCSSACARRVVLVIGERHKSLLEEHDPVAHEAYAAGCVAAQVIQTGPLVVSREQMAATVDGQRVNLTPRQISILVFLASHIGRVCTQQETLQAAWGPAYGQSDCWAADTHMLRVAISRLRTNLGHARWLVETKPGIGFLLRNIAAPDGTPFDLPSQPKPLFRWPAPRQERAYEVLVKAGPGGMRLDTFRTVALGGSTDRRTRSRLFHILNRLRAKGVSIDVTHASETSVGRIALVPTTGGAS